MIPIILRYGIVAGIIVSVPMLVHFLRLSPEDKDIDWGMLVAYTTMVVALTAVFLGVKRYRDRALGEVIRFLPALGLGLAISAVASILYGVAWEIFLAYGKFDFVAFYSKLILDEAQGKDAAAVAEAVRQAEWFRQVYAKPLQRFAFTVIEIFPVGVVISLISAAVLRNSRILPARATA